VTVYGAPPAAGSAVDCQVRISDVNPRQVSGDFDLLGEDGRVLMRVARWQDWRFFWPDRIFDFWRFPDREPNGIPVEVPEDPEVECRRIDAMGEIDNNGLWEVLWMQMILNARELAACRRIPDADGRRVWLLRRAVAKDAVRMWLRRHAQLDVPPADVEIAEEADGSLRVAGGWTGRTPRVPHVAVAVSGETGFGAASASPLLLTIDAAGVHVHHVDAPVAPVLSGAAWPQ